MQHADIRRGAGSTVAAGRFVHLRAITESDYRFLFDLFAYPENLHRFRFLGAPPAPELFDTFLWQFVHAQFLVVASRNSEPIGIVTSYEYSPRDGITYLAIATHPSQRGNGWTLEAAPIFIRYLFETFPIRRIYTEALHNNRSQVTSRVTNFELQVQRREHRWSQGAYRDMYVEALDRATWEASTRNRSSRRGSKPAFDSESVVRLSTLQTPRRPDDSGTGITLRPAIPSEMEGLYWQMRERHPNALTRLLPRGRTPAPHELFVYLWDGAYDVSVAMDNTGDIVSLLKLGRVDLTSKVGSVWQLPVGGKTHPDQKRALEAFVDLCFNLAPVRRLCVEMPSFEAEDFMASGGQYFDYEGTLRGHFYCWGEYHDVSSYGLLSSDWFAERSVGAR